MLPNCIAAALHVAVHSSFPGGMQVLTVATCRWLSKAKREATPQPKSAAGQSQRQAQQPQQPRRYNWYKGQEQGTKLSASRVLTEKEIEAIELGGA